MFASPVGYMLTSSGFPMWALVLIFLDSMDFLCKYPGSSKYQHSWPHHLASSQTSYCVEIRGGGVSANQSPQFLLPVGRVACLLESLESRPTMPKNFAGTGRHVLFEYFSLCPQVHFLLICETRY